MTRDVKDNKQQLTHVTEFQGCCLCVNKKLFLPGIWKLVVDLLDHFGEALFARKNLPAVPEDGHVASLVHPFFQPVLIEAGHLPVVP
jgi:hypothetical protein